MVLVFDMVFSLLTSSDGASSRHRANSQQQDSGFIPGAGLPCCEFSGSLWPEEPPYYPLA
jgi:hypothetical protein